MPNKSNNVRQVKRQHFLRDLLYHTSIVKLSIILVVLWIAFSAAIYITERGAEGTPITSFGWALYWGVAAFSTAGVASAPVNPLSGLIGAVWVIVGSILFFGAIVATVTSYIMRPINTPSSGVINTVEYNLERLDDLSDDELLMLKEAVNSLVEHRINSSDNERQ